jgi:hypothetical protein
MFRRCARQWYFKTVVASGIAKDPYRRRVHLLGKLQSVHAWRGQIVDHVISTVIVNAVRNNQRITLDYVKRRAHEQFQAELQFARNNRSLEVPFSSSTPDFVLLHPMYYVGDISQRDLDAALADIDAALANLYWMDEVKSEMKSATVLIPQRSLTFSHSGASVRAVPDLIAFYEDRPPVVFDWKVHTFGVHEAWLQLGVYALALTRCSPHKDFPAASPNLEPTQIELLEVQLLTKTCRRSRLEDVEIERVEAYIAESVTEIETALAGRSYSDVGPEDFGVTAYPNTCKTCAFQEVCWSNNEHH